MNYHFFLFCIAIILFCIMTFGVGSNDLANIMSTALGSNAISIKKCMFVIVIFECLGSFFGGSHIIYTIRHEIINTSQLYNTPLILIEGMLCILFSCAIWINISSYFGIPVSVTNSIIGSIVGFGATVFGIKSIYWKQIYNIIIGWIVSPLIASIISCIISLFSRRIIISGNINKVDKYIRFCFLIISTIFFYIIIIRSMQYLNLYINIKQSILLILLNSFILFFVIKATFIIIQSKITNDVQENKLSIYIEKNFSVLTILTTCFMVFAHGSNDIALVVGPLCIIYDAMCKNNLMFITTNHFSIYITILGCFGVILGFLIYGKKVVKTVGTSIVKLTPVFSFSSNLSSSTTIMIANGIGIPVSATQTLVGSILGVGMLQGIYKINLKILRNILTSWLLTLPVTSFLSIIFYITIHKIL